MSLLLAILEPLEVIVLIIDESSFTEAEQEYTMERDVIPIHIHDCHVGFLQDAIQCQQSLLKNHWRHPIPYAHSTSPLQAYQLPTQPFSSNQLYLHLHPFFDQPSSTLQISLLKKAIVH